VLPEVTVKRTSSPREAALFPVNFSLPLASCLLLGCRTCGANAAAHRDLLSLSAKARISQLRSQPPLTIARRQPFTRSKSTKESLYVPILSYPGCLGYPGCSGCLGRLGSPGSSWLSWLSRLLSLSCLLCPGCPGCPVCPTCPTRPLWVPYLSWVPWLSYLPYYPACSTRPAYSAQRHCEWKMYTRTSRCYN